MVEKNKSLAQKKNCINLVINTDKVDVLKTAMKDFRLVIEHLVEILTFGW